MWRQRYEVNHYQRDRNADRERDLRIEGYARNIRPSYTPRYDYRREEYKDYRQDYRSHRDECPIHSTEKYDNVITSEQIDSKHPYYQPREHLISKNR